MTTDFVILTPRKPLYGEPCNGCGICCQSMCCGVALDLHPEIKYLTHKPARIYCGTALANRCGNLMGIIYMSTATLKTKEK